jgi:ferredoxin-nitrate reductase
VQAYIPSKRRIVIIGAGTAALAFIEAHRRHNPRDEILLLGGESLPVYNRVLLPHYIDGSAPWESLVRADRGSLTPHRVIFHPNTLVSRIDRAGKTVLDSRGRAFAYDTLILATGSRPAIHYDGPVPASGTFTLRSRKDADAILHSAKAGKNAIIHGGGLLGLELAAALKTLGCNVTVLQRSDRLMGRQLDTTAAAHLAEELAMRNITVLFNTALVELAGTDALTNVRVQTGADAPISLHADLFIFATGTLPNKELAGAAGLDCSKGILVNNFLQTSDPAIFAIGECAEHDAQTYGTTPAAEAQASALAEFLRGNEHAPYKGTTTANLLKIPGLSLAAAGITDPPLTAPGEAPYETITLHDPRTRFYQKCTVQNDRLVGAICLGDTGNFSQYLEWISSGLELEDLRHTLLRPGAGAAKPVKGALVCSCHHVGAGTIEDAARENDCNLRKTCAATKAGTGCGSCRPEILAIVQRLLKERDSAQNGQPLEVDDRTEPSTPRPLPHALHT